MEQNNTSKKRVLLIGINFAPELTGIGKYTGEMVDWLVEKGYECTVISSFPYYPNWRVQAPYTGKFYKKEELKGGRLHLYRCPMYVPKNPTGLKRVLHEATFFLSALFVILRLLFQKGHQSIFCIAPPFHLGFLGLFYRFFKGGKIMYHIQDLQIEAARDLNVLKTASAFKVLFALEKFILKRVNHVSTISTGMRNIVLGKTGRHVTFFPNWVDIHTIYPLENRNDLKGVWGFKPDDKIILYSGSVGEKQGLESLIHIAKSLEDISFIKFVICGSGPYKEKLMELARQKKVNNLTFLALQPLHVFNEFINMADIHLVIQKKKACDLVMPSKLTSILSAGSLALVTAEEGSTLHTTVTEHNMGVAISCEDDEVLKDAILKCCTTDHRQTTSNGRKYAEIYLNKDRILRDVMSTMEGRRTSAVTISPLPAPSHRNELKPSDTITQ